MGSDPKSALGQPGEYDPALGKVFGMNRAEFEETDAMRVEAENHIMRESANSYRVVCLVRDGLKEWADGNVPDDMTDVLEQVKEWYDELEAVTKNG